MKHLRTYKIFENHGDDLPDSDKYKQLLNDLSLDIGDLGFSTEVKGYESYKDGYNTYDIIVKSDDKFEIYDVYKDNISDLNTIDKSLDRVNELNKVSKELIKRAVENGLYLCSFGITTKSDGIFSHIRFTSKQDGGPVDSDYRYYDGEDDY